jgi:alpha-mannosidase
LTGKEVSVIEKGENGYLYYQGKNASVAPVVYENEVAMSALNTVETQFFTVKFDEDGSMKEIALKDGRLAVKNANKLRVFIDTGDAWDFEDDYRDQPAQWMTLTACAARDFGDLVEVKQTYTYQNSTLEQTLLIHKNEPMIRILHDVNWKDNGYMLRAEFSPTAWSDTAYSDIQFGYLGRPTTDDTEHNAAQFETCCQKWFDVSNETQGFAVLNNAKCGFMAKQQTFSLNLLRATNYPCVTAEQKPIHYSYALYPHAGGFDPVKIDTLAAQFNARPVYGNRAVCVPTVESEAVQITAFKPAYDGDGFILRMFERSGKGAETMLTLPNGYRVAYETDLLEDKLGEATEGKLLFKPFQIRSFKVVK